MRTWRYPADLRPAGGEWCAEPDKAQWVDAATNFDCLIVRAATLWTLCGYVGLPPGHPLHGVDFFDKRLCGVNVHGGVNFSGPCQEGTGEAVGVCHVPEPGRPADVWWLGFSCAHAHTGDLVPMLAGVIRPHVVEACPAWLGYTYCSFPYVQREVSSLAQQLARVAA